MLCYCNYRCAGNTWITPAWTTRWPWYYNCWNWWGQVWKVEARNTRWGRYVDRHWVLCSSATLIPIVLQYVCMAWWWLPGSASWHRQPLCSEFVWIHHPLTRVHTNSIEGTWIWILSGVEESKRLYILTFIQSLTVYLLAYFDQVWWMKHTREAIIALSLYQIQYETLLFKKIKNLTQKPYKFLAHMVS